MYSCLSAEKLRDDLINVLNNSGVPLALGLYVFKDVYHMLNELYQDEINKERLQSHESITEVTEENFLIEDNNNYMEELKEKEENETD